jgi:CoA-transferase family III
MSSIRPLAGLVVVEIGHSISAPYAGMVLGGLGGEVIKVSPAIRNSIPSVVMNDGTLSPVVIGPIANPINAHAAGAHNCRDHGQPTTCACPMMNGDSAKT